MLRSIFVFLTFLLYSINAYKLLVYSPKFAKSHVTFMGKIADSLVNAGHDVVVYQPIYNENVTTSGTKHARVIERPIDFKPPASIDEIQDSWQLKDQDLSDLTKIVNRLSLSHGTLCEHQLTDKKLMDRLREEKFDLALGEPFDTCYFGLIEFIGVENFVSVFSFAMTENTPGMFGIPSTPSFSPSMVGGVPPFDYITRAKNLFATIFTYYMAPKFFFEPMEKILRSYVRHDFDIIKKIGESAFVLVNVDEHVDFPRPTSHKIINFGGFGMSKPNRLESKYEKIMNESKKGVVLLSFGSVAQSWQMPKVMKQKILETFAKFPEITFLWKYEKDEDNIAKGYKNVITDKWVPQTDLFAHPKLLAFISHGGQNSITEATFSGIPIICIPLFADQPRNGLIVEYRKIGVSLKKTDVIEGKLEGALKQILENENYRKNAKRLSEMIRAKPMSSDERLVKYVEFAAKFGNNNNLDMFGRHLNTIQYYCLDIIIPFIFLLILVFYLVYRISRFVIRKFFSLFVSKTKNKKE